MPDVYVATTGNDTTGDGSIANPFASPARGAAALATSSDVLWVKSGTYDINLALTVNTSGGPVRLIRSESATASLCMGYQNTPGDWGQRPVFRITNGSAGVYACSQTGNHSSYANIEVDGQNLPNTAGFSGTASGAKQAGCVAKNVSGIGFFSGSQMACAAINCGGIGLNPGVGCVGCIAIGCGGYGLSNGSNDFQVSFIDCIAYGCALGMFNSTGIMSGCLAHSNTSHGFVQGRSNTSPYLINCVSYGNGGFGWSATSANELIIGCAGGVNTSGNFSTTPKNISFITLTADPCINAAAWDFRPNAVANGGSLLRGSWFPGTLTGTSCPLHRDVGPLQSALSGSGGVSGSRIFTGF
jgi:hypothetical protein